jgi:hypothetical protein
MALIDQQIAKEDLATGIALSQLGEQDTGAATGWAAGAGAARALGGMFGMEDPRIVEQRAIADAMQNMDFRDPKNLYKIGQFMIQRGDWEKGNKMLELAGQIEYYQGSVAAKGAKSGASLKISLPELIKQHREGLIAFARDNKIDINSSQLRQETGDTYAQLSGKVTELANVLSKLQNQGADAADILASKEYNELVNQMYAEILGVGQTPPTTDPNEFLKNNPFPTGP